RNEKRRRDIAQHRVTPAQQGLRLGDAPALQIDQRLVMHFKLIQHQRAMQIDGQPQAQVRLVIHLAREVIELVLAGLLGRVHGLVRLARELFAVLAIERIQRYPDAARYMARVLAQGKRLGQRKQDLLRSEEHTSELQARENLV